MKIVPNSNILIQGQHAESGIPVETTEIIGKSLIAQGLAKPAPTSTSAEPAPAVETAAVRGGKKSAAAKSL